MLLVNPRWVNVIVYRYPSKTNPVIVNVYGFATKKEAQASQRAARRSFKELPVPQSMDLNGESRLIANRVRPVLVDGVDFGADLPVEVS